MAAYGTAGAYGNVDKARTAMATAEANRAANGGVPLNPDPRPGYDPTKQLRANYPTKAPKSGGAPDPGVGGRPAIPGEQPPATPGDPYGSQSGPGILENWFNQRASGTDPAFEYAMKRGMEGLNNQYGAAGSFNSGAARQGESDLYANLVAQRMGQLDQLAGGASGEHQGRLNSMFAQGQGIAQGQAGLASAYDLGAAGNMSAANQAMTQMALNKAGVDSQANQSLWNNLISGYSAYKSGGSGK